MGLANGPASCGLKVSAIEIRGKLRFRKPPMNDLVPDRHATPDETASDRLRGPSHFQLRGSVSLWFQLPDLGSRNPAKVVTDPAPSTSMLARAGSELKGTFGDGRDTSKSASRFIKIQYGYEYEISESFDGSRAGCYSLHAPRAKSTGPSRELTVFPSYTRRRPKGRRLFRLAACRYPGGTSPRVPLMGRSREARDSQARPSEDRDVGRRLPFARLAV